MLQHAISLIQRGFALVPLRPGTKIAAIPDFNNRPINSIALAQGYWRMNPNAGIGIILGIKSKLVCVDLDCNHGATEEDLERFPPTVTSKTRHGYHAYYRYPGLAIKSHALISPHDGKAASQAPAFLRCEGLYVVAPPSIVSFDKGQALEPFEYKFHYRHGVEMSFDDVALADCPAEWLEVSQVSSTSGREIPAGMRHTKLFDMAVAMRSKGKSLEQITESIHERNRLECKPPKTKEEGFDEEVRRIVEYVRDHTDVNPAQLSKPPTVVTRDDSKSNETHQSEQSTVSRSDNQGTQAEYLIPLGHKDDCYYYTSSSNQQITVIGRSAHTTAALLDLMPLQYWGKKFPKMAEEGPQGVLWTEAISALMEECRSVGVFDAKRTRGVGCWLDENKLVIHLGDRIQIGESEVSLNEHKSRFIYALSTYFPSPSRSPLSIHEGQALVDACRAPAWAEPSSGIYLAGLLAVFRLCGALPWRPHFWLTGASGSGKTTIMEYVVKPIAGHLALYFLGNTTEAGIRQELQCASRPVIFDEAETNDQRSGNRIRGVLELARQSSSETDGRIAKGTPSGRSFSYKINSSFALSSIRTNLAEEADRNRFTVLELKSADPRAWPAIARKFDPITAEYGDRLFARGIQQFQALLASREVIEEAVALHSDRRTAQQYSIILAGYHMLRSDTVATEAEAKELASVLTGAGIEEGKEAKDEEECLNHLLGYRVMYRSNDQTFHSTIGTVVEMVGKDMKEHVELLQSYGVDVDGGELKVASQNPQLSQIYQNTKWANGIWANAMSRIPGAKKSQRHYFGGRQIRVSTIPLSVIFQ